MMNDIFRDLISKGVLVYLDNITIYSNTFDNYLKILREVLMRLRYEGLFLKPNKYIFATHQVQLLGFVISKDGVTTDPDKVMAITKYLIPTDQTITRAILRLITYYRQFIKDFASIA